MFKKVIRLFLPIAVISVFSLSAFAQTDLPFDVEVHHPNVQAIEYVYENDIFSGHPDGRFEPDGILNRAEQLKVLLLAVGINPSVDDYNDCFPDVKREWFAGFICYAKENGIVEGYTDGYFRPAQQVNKVEALKIWAEIQEWPLLEPDDGPFSDVPAGEWFSNYVFTAKVNGLLEETGSFFLPADGISRAGTAELLFRSLTLERFLEADELVTAGDVDQILVTEKPSAVIAGEFSTVEFTLKGGAGEALPGLSLNAYVEYPSRYLEEDFVTQFPSNFVVQDLGDGNYSVDFEGYSAGSHPLVIKDVLTDKVIDRIDLNIVPGFPEELIPYDIEGEGGEDLSAREYHMALIDEFGNIVSGASFSANADYANVQVVKNSDGTASIRFDGLGYGLGNVDVEINAIYQNEGFQYNDLFEFEPIGLVYDPAYEVGEGFGIVEMPVLLNLPTMADYVNMVNFQLDLPKEMSYVGYDINDSLFSGEVSEMTREDGGVSLLFSGNIETSGDFFIGEVASLIFNDIEEGEWDIVSDLNLYTEDPELPEVLFRDTVGTVANEDGIYVTTRPLAAIKGKTVKRICINAFIQPGTGVTKEQVESDVKQTEDIFHKNAKSCNCPHYLKIDVNVLTFSKDQWSKLTGDDGFDSGDVVEMYKTNTPIAPMRWCTKAFYVDNGEDSTEAGQSVRTRDMYDEFGNPEYGMGPYIEIDNAKDKDGRTMAHEMAHHLSGQKILDPGRRGARQGAGSKGNLMTYGKEAGDDLTKTQCDLISWDHPRFSAYPPNQK